MKVLNIMTSGLRTEGIATTQLVFMRRLDKSKIEMNIAAVHDNDPYVINEFKKIGCHVVIFPDRTQSTIRYFFALYNELKKEKYDIVHVHGSSALLAVDLMAAKLAGVPVRIAHSRNTRCNNGKIDRLLRPVFYMSYTDAMACGEEAGKWLFGNREFKVMHNGKDFSDFCFSKKLRELERKQLGLDGKLVFGHVGRFNEQKNHKYLIDVFYRISQMRENAVLYLIGDGHLSAEIHKYVEELGIEDKAIFAGSVLDVSHRLQAMDFMIFPSLFEGLPNVVLEWQAEGLPCLISDTITRECAPSNLVEFMSLESSAQTWADKALQMLDSYQNREENAQRATTALKKAGFDIENNARELTAVYYKLLRKRNK